MGQSANKTIPVKVQPNVQTVGYLEQLVKLGIYGNSKAEVIISLVNDQLKVLLKDRTIEK